MLEAVTIGEVRFVNRLSPLPLETRPGAGKPRLGLTNATEPSRPRSASRRPTQVPTDDYPIMPMRRVDRHVASEQNIGDEPVLRRRAAIERGDLRHGQSAIHTRTSRIAPAKKLSRLARPTPTGARARRRDRRGPWQYVEVRSVPV